jgi:hybrid cluster-associated redox disulfide protein
MAAKKSNAKVNPATGTSKPKAQDIKAKQEAITKDMTLGELVTRYPQTAQIMFSYGLHCIGCHMAAHETIEQGASAHGMDAKEIAKMVREMNDAVKA